MLAFVLAIGMSFAFVNATDENYYASGFVEIDGEPYSVEVNCDNPSTITCQVNIQGLPNNPYTVTDALGAPLLNGTGTIKTIPDPR
ncbi:DUF6520 family protein [Galbibacter marinus]